CGSRAAWRRTSRPSRISARTMALPSAKSVANSSWSAGAPACLRPQRSPSTEASSRRSTRATGISRKPRRPSGWSRSRRASSVICPSLKPPTASQRGKSILCWPLLLTDVFLSQDPVYQVGVLFHTPPRKPKRKRVPLETTTSYIGGCVYESFYRHAEIDDHASFQFCKNARRRRLLRPCTRTLV